MDRYAKNASPVFSLKLDQVLTALVSGRFSAHAWEVETVKWSHTLRGK